MQVRLSFLKRTNLDTDFFFPPRHHMHLEILFRKHLDFLWDTVKKEIGPQLAALSQKGKKLVLSDPLVLTFTILWNV